VVGAYRRRQSFAGDHHTHSRYSHDGLYDVETLARSAREHGLDWIVVTDHGGVTHSRLSLPRISAEVAAVRQDVRGLRVFQGLEWNVPGADHATVVVPPGRGGLDVLAEFEAAWDGEVLSTPTALGGLGRVARITSDDGEPFALDALRWLATQVDSGRVPLALMVAHHPGRRGVNSPHELRAWRDAAPGVAVGMEGAPGHQAGAVPTELGGRGRTRGYYDAAPDRDSFPGYDPTPDEDPYRTYGGFDWMTARVGGVWDAMLAEGAGWWVTATSDCHQVFGDTLARDRSHDYHRTGSTAAVETGLLQEYGDFWPGQYSRTLVAADSASYLDVLRGLQSGRVVAVHGGLVENVDVRVHTDPGDPRGVGIGGRTWVRRGGDVHLDVEITPARRPNDSGDVPRLATVDLIAGPVTGPAPDRDAMWAPETAVVETFVLSPTDRAVLRYTFRQVERPFYLRLRGSDGRRTTADGGPRVDAPDGTGHVDPWNDLWFYANPVFVDVR